MPKQKQSKYDEEHLDSCEAVIDNQSVTEDEELPETNMVPGLTPKRELPKKEKKNVILK
jgi:hypothetical protein